MKATTRNALLAGNAFDRMRSAHVSDGACHRSGVAGLLPPDDYWTDVPSSCDRSFGIDALHTGPDLRSALDDLVLKAHFVAPVVAEHVLGSGLIDHNQKMTVAAIAIADMKV